MKPIHLAVLAILAGASTAQAQTFATGPIYGGPTQTTGICTLYNAGTVSVSLASADIRDQNGNVPTATTGCPVTLVPGAACRITLALPATGLAYACEAAAGAPSSLRGSFSLENSTGVVLNSQPLR